MSSPSFTLFSSEKTQINPWAPLGTIAERLGVKPLEGRDHRATVIIPGAKDLPLNGSGRAPTYDLFEIAEALLDRLDRIAPELKG